MKEDEELVKAIVDTLFHEFASDYRQEAIDRMKDMSLTAKLLSRLERGRIAIEAMGKLNAAQKEYFDRPEMGKEVFVNTSLNIIREYKHE